MRPRSNDSTWWTVVTAVAVSRVLWLGVFAAVIAIDFPGRAIWPGLHDTLVSWDAIAYIDIAAHGYPAFPNYLDAFLPGFPLIVHAVGLVTRDAVIAAWVVNVGAETVALWYISQLVRAERDRSAATLAVWLVALAPTALFLSRRSPRVRSSPLQRPRCTTRAAAGIAPQWSPRRWHAASVSPGWRCSLRSPTSSCAAPAGGLDRACCCWR